MLWYTGIMLPLPLEQKGIERLGKTMTASWPHFDQIQDATPSAQGGEECLKIGDTWVQLRECLIRTRAMTEQFGVRAPKSGLCQD